MPTTSTISVLGKSLKIQRLLLKKRAKLDELGQSMGDAVSKGDFDKYYLLLVQFVETALTQDKVDWNKVPWQEFLVAYSEVVKLNAPTLEFPILVSSKKKQDKKLPWEYDGRAWYFWLNLFASNYGWDEKKIENMDIDTALGLYQEILMDEQFAKEWTWQLSEISYPYNQSSKKQEFKPLERPEWMLPLAPTHLPVIRMRKDMMPMGNIMDLSAK